MRAPGPYNINLLPHLCFLAFKGHGRPGAACVCLSVCVCVCVWQAKRWLVKGCDSRATYRGHHPQDPRAWTIQYCTTHTHTQTHMVTHTCYLQRGTGGPMLLVTCVCNHRPPPPCHHSSPSIFSLFFQMQISKQTRLKRRINEININILRRWQACKLKRGDATLAICRKRDEFGTEWTSKCGSEVALSVFTRTRLCVCASAVCSDQTHWCVIGSPLSRWPLRLECLSWWRTGGGRTDDNVLQMTLTHTHTHCKYFV